MLDLSAAFDTENHERFLNRITDRFGIQGNTLRWFVSYLAGRKQFVKIGENRSSSRALNFGLLFSVLGPLLYFLYIVPLGDLMRDNGVSFHLYANDTQLYLSFETSVTGDQKHAQAKVEKCVRPDINE